MTYNGLSDAMETLSNNACIQTDICQLANRLGWSLSDIEGEGIDTTRLAECPVCGHIFVTAALRGHCSDDCKQKGLWADRRRNERQRRDIVSVYARTLRESEF